MYKNRTKGSSLKDGSQKSGNIRGSDIVAPNNTSLIVQRSGISEESEDELPKSVTAILYEDDSSSESLDLARPSSSFYNSLKAKTQSTPNKIREEQIPRTSCQQSQHGYQLLYSKTQDSTNNFFLSTAASCGAVEISGVGSFKLSDDQAVFVRKLNSILSTEPCVDRFVSCLKEYWNCDDNLKKLLMLTQTSQDCEVARGPVQEPLLRLLLMVDCLQSKLLQLLFEKVNAIVERSGGEDIRVFLVSSILRQARCLNRLAPTPHVGTQLLSLVDKCSDNIAKEIIFLLPELIVEQERADVASKLLDRLHDVKETTGFVIDCLGNLALTETTKAQVRDEMLVKLDHYPLPYLPSIVNFVLSRIDNANALQAISSLRKNLLSSPLQTPSFDGSTGKINAELVCKVFDILKDSSMVSKSVADAWLKEISNISLDSSSRPIDLMMLAIIHSCLIGRKSAVLTIVKNRIRACVFLDSLAVETFRVLRPVIMKNHREVLEFCSALIKSCEPSVADFAVTMYKEMFVASGEFHRQDVISDIVMHITTGSSSTVRNVLQVLMRIRETDRVAVNSYAASFMSALRALLKLDLPQARLLADIVASVVMTIEEEDSGLIEELLIFVRKLMSSWQSEAQHRGVVAAVMAIKHAALVNDVAFHDKFELKFLLKMAAGAQSACGTRRGFFLDELASTLAAVPSRPAFLTSWVDRVFNYILQHYFASKIESQCDEFPMSLQFSIDDSSNLVLPIVAFIVIPEESAYINIWSLPAAMRLLWSAEKGLSRIDDILSAAVILPDLNVFDKFLTFSPATQKTIMDCLFVCANYFIECINALSSVKPSEKIIIRIKQLIDVRKLILKHIGLVPEYSPPPCQFHFKVAKVTKKAGESSSKKPRGRKRKSDGATVDNINATNMDTSVMPATATAAPAEAFAQLTPCQPNAELNAYAGYFRELSFSAYRLLRMPLVLNPTKVYKKKKVSDRIVSDVSWSFRPEDKPELGPSDTLFLLEDYLVKSDAILREKPPFLQKKPVGLILETMTSAMFISGCIKLLPKFCLKLDVTSRFCKDLLESNDGMWDASGCFPPDSAEIKICYCALLNIISDILAWKGFQSPKHKRALSDTMMILARKNPPAGTQGHTVFATEAAHFLAGLCDSVPLLWGGVCLAKAVHSCVQLSDSQDYTVVGDVCGNLLKRPWFTVTGSRDSGPSYNQHIDFLVRLYLSCVADRLQTVLLMAEMAAEEVPGLVSKDSAVPSYPALTKGNFAVMYRAMCEALVSASGTELSRRSGDDEGMIELWGVVTKVLTLLVDVAKSNSSRAILSALLKRSQSIINQFLTKGMPVMEAALRIKSEAVLSILKALQGVTRFFNAVCCHSKMTKDAVIAAHVPHIRALCERLTLEVKGVLILNKIPLECITISVLRNRDLQGNDIPSQANMANSDDDSELPDDDSDVPNEFNISEVDANVDD